MFFFTINLFGECIAYLVCSIVYLFILFHSVLPLGFDVGIVGFAAYYLTRLRKPNPRNVTNIFGPLPGSKEGDEEPSKIVRCIAHRGAALDAPENTMEAFKNCVAQDCRFVELDVRTSKDGKLVLLHDQGLERLTSSEITNIQAVDWDSIKDIDIGAKHPNRDKFKEVKLCLLEDALDYLVQNKVKIIIDIKGEDRRVIEGIINIFMSRPALYECAAVTCFNPFVIYQLRKKDPNIVGAMSYRPYAFSALDYDAQTGPTNPRYGENLFAHAFLRAADLLHSLLWRWSARWCGVSAVLLHKDIVSPNEVQYWHSLGIRCAGWTVNRPLEKLYWRGVLKAPYLANTLVAEPDIEERKEQDQPVEHPANLVDDLLKTDRRATGI